MRPVSLPPADGLVEQCLIEDLSQAALVFSLAAIDAHGHLGVCVIDELVVAFGLVGLDGFDEHDLLVAGPHQTISDKF